MRIQGIYRAVMEAGIKASLANGLTGDASTKLEQTVWYRETETLRRDAETSDGRVIANASLHAQYTSAPELVRQIAEYAKDKQLRMHVHLSETIGEHEECKEKYGKTPARYFTDLGLFDVPTSAAHAIFIEGEDYDLLRDKKVTLCHNPSSNLKIGSGLADVKKWRDHGIRVTIGTDGAGSNNNLDMIEEVTLASYLAKGIHRDPLLFSTGELLTFATRNGALAQGREDTGLLEPGYRADLAVVDMTSLHFQPLYDIGTSLFTNANASDVVLTMVDGRILYKDGQFTTIDIEKVLWNVYRIRDRNLATLAE
jgi:5-methylthioadenosine/S-adenosylhomocysteine deaminase